LDTFYPNSASVAYASKAFLCVAIAQLLAREGLGLDIVSGGELYTALRAGFPPERIHFHGNNKTPAEIAYAIEAGVGRIVVDSPHELRTLEQLAARYDRTATIWFRISPGIDVHTHSYRKTGLVDSKFGLSLTTDDIARVTERVLSNPRLQLAGLHAHIGSQVFELEPLIQTIQTLLDVASRMHDCGLCVSELSPGGGLGVRYVDTDPAMSIKSYVQRLCEAVVRECAMRELPLPHLVLEPGRSIIASAGVALYTVGTRKEIPGIRTYISIDGGLADNPRPALYQAAYTAVLANKAGLPATEAVTVAGKFCESGDILIRDAQLPSVEAGDILAVPVSGAYQLSMSSNYNQTPRPAVALVHRGCARLIVRRETYGDLVRRDLPLGDGTII
jgi:diaminopimelate decarboxylase